MVLRLPLVFAFIIHYVPAQFSYGFKFPSLPRLFAQSLKSLTSLKPLKSLTSLKSLQSLKSLKSLNSLNSLLTR